VRKDPRSDGTLADIEAQVAMQIELREDIKSAAGKINDIEWIKKQLDDLVVVLEQDDRAADVVVRAESLYSELQAVEDKVLQPIAAEGDSKSFRYPNRLYSQLSVLAGNLASSVDFAPNRQQREVHAVLKARLVQYQAELQELLENNVAAFNRMIRERGLTIIAGR
jgi:hypothetical protein